MLSCLVRQHKYELFHALLYSPLSIAPVYHTMSILSITFLVYQPFEMVMEKSGVKTRSSEQAMVPVEAYMSMVIGSSSEEDSETEDQSYIPSEVYALCCNVYISHMMHMVSFIA